MDTGEISTAESVEPAVEAGLESNESQEIVTDETEENTTLSAEEELSALPDSDETAADAEEDRDATKQDSQ